MNLYSAVISANISLKRTSTDATFQIFIPTEKITAGSALVYIFMSSPMITRNLFGRHGNQEFMIAKCHCIPMGPQKPQYLLGCRGN